MKHLLLIFIVLFSSCSEQQKKEENNLEIETSSVSSKIDIDQNESFYIEQSNLGPEDLKLKVFDFGRKSDLTDTCTFYFECDCCSGTFVFDSDSTFYYLDQCMNDQTAMTGKFNIIRSNIVLKYSGYCVSRKYNWEREVNPDATEYIMSDTSMKPSTLKFTLKKCGDNLLLTSETEDYWALETKNDYKTALYYLEESGFVERLKK